MTCGVKFSIIPDYQTRVICILLCDYSYFFLAAGHAYFSPAAFFSKPTCRFPANCTSSVAIIGHFSAMRILQARDLNRRAGILCAGLHDTLYDLQKPSHL